MFELPEKDISNVLVQFKHKPLQLIIEYCLHLTHKRILLIVYHINKLQYHGNSSRQLSSPLPPFLDEQWWSFLQQETLRLASILE